MIFLFLILDRYLIHASASSTDNIVVYLYLLLRFFIISLCIY